MPEPPTQEPVAVNEPASEAPASTNGKKRVYGKPFEKGNKLGKGNPWAKKLGMWKATLYRSISYADIKRVLAKLKEEADKGEGWAVKEFLDRCYGKAPQPLEHGGLEGAPLPPFVIVIPPDMAPPPPAEETKP